ncbi:MAG: hypothetical protein Q9166_001461 [cf. Caloplaca sp. 2 TL-2023]
MQRSLNLWVLQISRSCTRTFEGTLVAAHVRTDPITGDHFISNLELGRAATYRIFKISVPTGKTEILATLKGIRSAYYTKGGVKILWTKNVVDAIDLDPNEKNKWLVINRRHGKGLVGISDRGNSVFLEGLIRFDTETKTALSRIGHAQSPGEPIFVADPNGKEEDNGVLLSVVLDRIIGKS